MGIASKELQQLQHCNKMLSQKKNFMEMKNFLRNIREPQWKIRTFAPSMKKDKICGPPRRQKLHSAQASVTRAEVKKESNSEIEKIINKI